MRRNLLFFTLLLCFSASVQAQERTAKGRVIDASTQQPIEAANLRFRSSTQQVNTDVHGRFTVKIPAGTDSVYISAIGYTTQAFAVAQLQADFKVALAAVSVQLKEVSVAQAANNPFKPISQMDIKLRAVNNSQEVLRMVPGLFIGQHAGGGKAEQIFLRGFDIDHGTDINITADGMPVNMVSHAHGQGYADLHFLIPELIQQVDFKKGPYYADKGNLNTAGFVDFKTKDVLTNSMVKLEAGAFNTWRGVGMFDLLGEKAKANEQSAFIASEYMYSKGYFDHPQDFNRLNLFGKYHGRISPQTTLTASASTFTSSWDASGQIPDRAVKDGSISWFGAIDPNEGGKTSRTNANVQTVTTLNHDAYLKNQVFYSHYKFTLFSNFTFFLNDEVNGDQIKQHEDRNLFGYNGSYVKNGYWGNKKLSSEVGINVRYDKTNNSELSHTKDRSTLIDPIKLGDINELNLAAYWMESIELSQRFTLSGGLRFDHFEMGYKDKLENNTKSTAGGNTVSPKLNLQYKASEFAYLYLNSGKGFHSNDTRVVVKQDGRQVLPAGYGSDLGTILKPTKNLLINAALWYLWLDQEFVYVGDEGVVEPSGKSRRMGFDVSVRYQPTNWLYLDADANYAHGRAVEEAKGENYLPLSPRFTSTGGITYRSKMGINAFMRYRYMGDRPANEDNSVIAKGYFVADAGVTYSKRKFEIGLNVQNVFDTKWKETQFDTESRLANEVAPVSEIHFTPGTPFFLKASLSYFF
ncbi:TonB-dependent receptor [Chitinophaga skermanii]|nr:TonB-dependent receptor [Chitinophaga skermanii]